MPIQSDHSSGDLFARRPSIFSRPPVVLQVLPALVTGGVERGTVDIAEALVAAGARAIVASAGGPMVREILRAGAEHVKLPLKTKNPLGIWLNAGRLARLIRRERVDIVHARSRAPAWSAYWAAQRTHTHFVTTFHSPYGSGSGIIRPWKERYNSVMAKGERVIAISGYVAREIERRFAVPPERVRLIHRGVDLDRFDPARVPATRIIQLANAWKLPEEARVVLLPGRLTRWKGQSVLIDAVARLARDPAFEDVHIVMVGSDQGRLAYAEELATRAERAGLGGRVHLVGECRDMPAAFRLADVVVSASTAPEAFGRVMAEGLAMGKPLVAADHGAAPEIVRPGETGWLVPPGDVAALAEGLRTALALDETARDMLATAAIADVRTRFSKAAMTTATLAVYAEMLAS